MSKTRKYGKEQKNQNKSQNLGMDKTEEKNISRVFRIWKTDHEGTWKYKASAAKS